MSQENDCPGASVVDDRKPVLSPSSVRMDRRENSAVHDASWIGVQQVSTLDFEAFDRANLARSNSSGVVISAAVRLQPFAPAQPFEGGRGFPGCASRRRQNESSAVASSS
jgi:hypothetical protein